MVYEWGSRSYPVDPNLAAEEVSRIAAANEGGAALAAAIVEEARPEGALLHPAIFRESQEEAAESWRRQVARQLVSSLVIVTEDEQGEKIKAPAFYHVSFDRGDSQVRGYQSVSIVVGADDSRESAEAVVLRQLRGLRRRYDGLAQFENVWAEVDRVEHMLAVAA